VPTKNTPPPLLVVMTAVPAVLELLNCVRPPLLLIVAELALEALKNCVMLLTTLVMVALSRHHSAFQNPHRKWSPTYAYN
jgi:hypothetical protein